MKILATACLAAIAATSAYSAPTQWTTGPGANDHWYDFVILSTEITAEAAETAAEASTLSGQSGYLATITSAEEQAFLNAIWPGAGSVTGQFDDLSYFLIGASDRDTEGSFTWIGGPEESAAVTYTNWASGEPNDLTGEDYVAAWWNDTAAGEWNDINGLGINAYVVEFSAIAAVPLPASLPLMLLAFGGFATLRRHTKSA